MQGSVVNAASVPTAATLLHAKPRYAKSQARSQAGKPSQARPIRLHVDAHTAHHDKHEPRQTNPFLLPHIYRYPGILESTEFTNLSGACIGFVPNCTGVLGGVIEPKPDLNDGVGREFTEKIHPDTLWYALYSRPLQKKVFASTLCDAASSATSVLPIALFENGTRAG